jgi:hypothetical protein
MSLKHKLDRKSLEKLCIGFISPLLEYGGIVWDNCSLHESELLESVQLEAVSINVYSLFSIIKETFNPF